MKPFMWGACALALVLTGCGGDKAEAPKEGEKAAEAAADDKGSEAPEAKKEEAGKADSKAAAGAGVEDRLASWCSTQTKGDFEAYSAYYAEDFKGIKRTKRGKETKFDRKKWLKDRGGMFKMPLQVDCQDVKVGEAKDGVTSITFEQYWQAPSYADAGPKRVDFKDVDGTWMIVWGRR